MLAKRIIPCLDIAEGRVVKGINFVNLRDAGDPVEVARRPVRRGFAEAAEALRDHDAILVATDHDAVDYALIATHARLIVDTRNVFERKGAAMETVVKA